MFKRIITHKHFWKSVLFSGATFGVLFFIVKWALTRFSATFFNVTPRFIITLLGASFIYGFLMTYGKFWGKLKSEDYKNDL